MEMAEVSDDPYELRLYHMFQSCDTEHCGLLDEVALRRLCILLELRDKGALLIEDLTNDGGINVRVSFARFKAALLQFLGTELDTEQQQQNSNNNNKSKVQNSSNILTINDYKHSGSTSLTDQETERVMVISDDTPSSTYLENTCELSDREVAPKLVVGTKKYGRRSRPQKQTIDDGLSPSESEVNEDVAETSAAVQRSSSQTDIIAANRQRRTVALNGSKLKRCSSLPAQRNLKQQLVTKKYEKQQKESKGTMQNTQNGSSVESLGVEIFLQNCYKRYDTQRHGYNDANGYQYSLLAKDDPPPLDSLPKHSILELWERANITNGRGVLLALGFDEDEINLTQLLKVLEEEVKGCLESDTSSHAIFVRSLLALQTAELATLRVTCRQLHEENVKLRADNKEANRRVNFMAVEIDERHASLEDSSKKELLALEQRHANILRELSTKMAADRENWTQTTAKLEATIKKFEEEEIKLRTELDMLRSENTEMEADQQQLQRQVTELLEQNIKLNREIADLEDSQDRSKTICITEDSRSLTSSQIETEDEQVLLLLKKVESFQLENTQLRDKNDELLMEVENLNLDLKRLRAREKRSPTSFIELTGNEEVESGGVNTATKRRGDSPSQPPLHEASPRLGKLRKCSTEMDEEIAVETLGAELQTTEINLAADNLEELRKRIVDLEKELSVLKKAEEREETTSTKSTEERCKELEASLEQMQRAYEDCEDYWQNKLSEERQLFDKERLLYEEEQQDNDKKFTELMEKVREYEEQFSKESRLSPIEEKDVLEQQYMDLEAEVEQLREQAQKMWEEKSLEIEELHQEIADLKMRLGESVEILTGATEMHTEAKAAAASALQGNSPASSPISYLWQQSTIQQPAKHIEELANEFKGNQNKTVPARNTQTSETVFSTESPTVDQISTVAPIQKPISSVSIDGDGADSDKCSVGSGKSYDTHSVASTHSIHQPLQLHQLQKRHNQTSSSQDASRDSTTSPSPTPSGVKEDLKRLKFFEISLKERIKDLTVQRDGIIMELQQLQAARPVLEKAYARTAHPTLIQRVNQLELKNRHLQNVIKQHQQYTESLMQQSWRQHQMELNDLHTRLETQNVMMSEQAHRLQNADVLVKDLYVENSHLTATVQHLEQQHLRSQMLHNMQHVQQQGMSSPNPLLHQRLPGMP